MCTVLVSLFLQWFRMVLLWIQNTKYASLLQGNIQIKINELAFDESKQNIQNEPEPESKLLFFGDDAKNNVRKSTFD